MDPAELLKSVRRRTHLTQAQLARRAGTSQPVVSAYEGGHRDPTYSTLRRLIAASGLQLQLRAMPEPDLPPAADVREHADRLLQVLDLAGAFPARDRGRMDAPRLIST